MKRIVLQISNHRLQCDSWLDGRSDTHRPKVVAVARSVVGRAAVGDSTGSLTNCPDKECDMTAYCGSLFLPSAVRDVPARNNAAAIKKIAMRSSSKRRPEAWRVLLENERDWRDVPPLVGAFIKCIAGWSGVWSVSRDGYSSEPGEGPAKWLVWSVVPGNTLGELINCDPSQLPIVPNRTGKGLAAFVPLEARDEYAARFIKETR